MKKTLLKLLALGELKQSNKPDVDLVRFNVSMMGMR